MVAQNSSLVTFKTKHTATKNSKKWIDTSKKSEQAHLPDVGGAESIIQSDTGIPVCMVLKKPGIPVYLPLLVIFLLTIIFLVKNN